MKIKALLLSLLLATTALADNHLTGPSVTVDTDGSEVTGQVNIATQGTGNIQFFTNKTRRGYIDGTTGVLTGFSFGSSTLTSPTISGNLTFSTAAAKIIPGATSLTFRNNADGADNLSIANGGDVTLGQGNLIFSAAAASVTGGATSLTLKSAGTTIIDPQSDINRLITFTSTSDTAFGMTFGDAGATAVQKFTISASTADADDDSTLQLTGGGAVGTTRGGFITIAGEEVSGGGDIIINSGGTAGDTVDVISVAGGGINLQSDTITMKTSAGTTGMTFGMSASTPAVRGGTTSFQINNNANSVANLTIADAGSATFRDTITSSRTTDIGWSVVSGANVACNTTCTSACVVGFDTTAGVYTMKACTDATSDICLCAGAS